jgi:hypothetical protein
MKDIFLFDGSKKTGPFSEVELSNLKLTKRMRYWHDGMPKWLPIENLPFVKIENSRNPKPIKLRNYKLITTMWIITSIILLLVMLLYTFFFNEFGESELVQFSFFWFGAIIFCATTLIAAYSKSNKPLLYGLLAAISGTLFLILFFGTLWSAL